MIGNKWYCIAQTGTFDTSCSINVSFADSQIKFSAAVKYGSSALNISYCYLQEMYLVSVRLRQTESLWCVDLLCNLDITPTINVSDSPYWTAVNAEAGAGEVITTINHISKEFNTETKGGGESLFELVNVGTEDKPIYAVVPKSIGGVEVGIISNTFMSMAGFSTSDGDDDPGGESVIGIVTIRLGDTEYHSENGIVELPAYPTIPKKISVFENDSEYITESALNPIYTKIKEIKDNDALQDERLESLEAMWYYDETYGALRTPHNIIIDGTLSMYGTSEYVPGGGGGLSSVTVRVNGVDYVSDNGIVTLPDLLPKSGGTISGDLLLNQYLKINAWSGYGSGSANVWYDGNVNRLYWENATDMQLANNVVLHGGNYSSYALPLSGGILSDSWSGGTEIRRKDSTNGYVSLIFSQADGTVLGRFGFGGVDNPLFITQAGGYNTLIHSNNIGSQSVNYASSAGTLTDLGSPTTDTVADYVAAYGSNGLSVLVNTSGSAVGNIGAYSTALNIGDRVSRFGRFIFARNDESDALYWQTVNAAQNGWARLRTIAFTDSNVASATKLQTARSIWGQSFDGTGDITGNFTLTNADQINGNWGIALCVDCGGLVDTSIWNGQGVENVRFKANGNILMGTTSGIGHSRGKLQVYEASNEWGSIVYTNKAAVLSSHIGGYGMLVTSTNNNNGTYLLSVKYNDASLSGGGDTALLVKDNGNIIIGATSDNGAKLQVNGKVTTYGDINLQSVGEITHAKSISLYDNGMGYYVGSRNSGLGVTDGGALIYTYGATPISLYVNGSERMRVADNGNVLIGTTTNWGFRFASNALSGDKISGYLGSGGGAFFGNIDKGYGTAIWTQGNGNGYIQQGRSNGAVVSYNLVMQHLGGNVLIGTTDDNTAKLQVDGNMSLTSALTMKFYGNATCGLYPNSWIASDGVNNRLWLYNDNQLALYGSHIDLRNNTTVYGYISANTLYSYDWFRSYNATGWYNETYGGGIYMTDANYVRVYNGKGFWCDGDIISEGTITMAKLASSSDAKLKENIKLLSADRAIGVVKALRPTEWNWRKDGKKSYGLIAQEVEPIVPEMVVNMEHLHLEYNQLHAFEIGAIQHIDSEVEQLKRGLKTANNRIEQLESKLKQYELWQ